MSGLIERLRAAEKDIADHGGYDQHARTISDAIAAIGGEGAGENCRVSQDEIKEMFGENMPFAAAKILFPEKSEPLTLDELRFVLRSIAAWNHRSGEGAGVSEALAYAERLAIALHAKHYASDAPQWKSLSGDLIGILTQIDNMTSGLSRSALTATQSAPAPGGWREALNEAPKDGTMVRLLVRPLEGEGWTPFADSWDPYETIGFNNLANTGEDEWQFAGWDWSHDCFTDGRGVVIGWAPLCASPAPEPVADAVAEDCWRELVEKTDRTSPEEYPNMALITRHELAGFIGRAPRAGTTAEEAGWVIERGDSDTSAPTYWTGHDMWSQDHMDAVRFARKVDGEKAAAREQRWHGLAHRVCEHMWMAALAQPAPAAQEAPSGVVEAWRIAEDALASISGERTPQRFPETSYDLAARALNEARAALAERQPQPQEGREKLPQWWRPSPKLKLALEHYRGVKADFEEFDGDRRGIGAALSERAFGVLQAIADDHLEDDDGDQNYHLVRLVIGLIDRLTAAPLPSQEGE